MNSSINRSVGLMSAVFDGVCELFVIFFILFIIYIKERKTVVTHNTEITYLYTRLLSYANTFSQETKT